MVSIITCTMRPSWIDNVFSNYDRQDFENKELIIILNRNDMDISIWEKKAEEYKNVFVYQVPEEYTLGRCMNYAITKANYDIIAKFDDDDYYAPPYLEEAVNAMNNTNAPIIGKNKGFIYFEETEALMIRKAGNEYKYCEFIKGGTLVFKKSVWEKVKFQDRAVGSDTQFLRDCIKQGFRIYSTSKYNYVYIRRQDISTHTYQASTQKIMDGCNILCYTENYIPILTKIPEKYAEIKAQFRRSQGYDLDLENPRTLSEKIQWIKIYGGLERFSGYVDKYNVREFVKERIGEQYLIPLIGVYLDVDHIDFLSLPKSFVMKATHGSGWNIFVKDKSKIDWDAAKEKMRQWISSNYYELKGQPNYKPLKGRVLVENYLEDPSGILKDYRFYCFHGTPMYIQVEGKSNIRRDFYDCNWRRLPVQQRCENFKNAIPKPKLLDNMISIARKLSKDFPLVRVDLYHTSDDQIFFSELTFTPYNGFSSIKPVEYDVIFGSYLDLSKYV